LEEDARWYIYIYIYIYIAFFEEASYILYMYQPAGKLRSIYF
jgi:hypothetical protein